MKLRDLEKKAFNTLIQFTHRITENPQLDPVGRPVMRTLGWINLRVKKAQHPEKVEDLGREWQRMFPSRKMVPITDVTEDTVYAEIHSPCPYRGSGNVEGCYRMMEYDRRMLEEIGGEFVVLRSQAEPGVTTCRVAIRRRGADTTDLVPAHLKQAST